MANIVRASGEILNSAAAFAAAFGSIGTIAEEGAKLGVVALSGYREELEQAQQATIPMRVEVRKLEAEEELLKAQKRLADLKKELKVK